MAYKCGNTPQVGDLVVRDSKHPHNRLGELHHKVVQLRGTDILLEGIDDTWYADRFNLVSRGSVPGQRLSVGYQLHDGDVVQRVNGSDDKYHGIFHGSNYTVQQDVVVKNETCLQLVGITGSWNPTNFSLVRKAGTNPATQGVPNVNKIEDPVKTAEKAAAELLKQAETTAAKLVADAEEAAARAAAEKEKLDREAAVSARLEHEKALATATVTLLADIGAVRVGANVMQRGVYAKFRNELNPLAQSYGYKLVLVGDKTQGVLVVA